MLKITVGPPHIASNQGHTVLVTEPDGQISLHSQKGLYFRDTRLVSGWNICANGASWELLNGGNLYHYASKIFLTNREIGTEKGIIKPRTLQLTLSRAIDGGMHEDIDIVNYGRDVAEFNLEIQIRSDFADLFEAKSGKVFTRGRITSRWSAEDGSLRAIYRNRDFCRELTVLTKASDTAPAFANGQIVFAINLAPGSAWHACLLYEFGNGKGAPRRHRNALPTASNRRWGGALKNGGKRP
jgi:hypothetical protein